MIDRANYNDLRRIRSTNGYSFRAYVAGLDEAYMSAKKFLLDVQDYAEELDVNGQGEEIVAITGFYRGWNIRLRVSRDYFTIVVSKGKDKRAIDSWQFASKFEGASMDDFEYYVIQKIQKLEAQAKSA